MPNESSSWPCTVEEGGMNEKLARAIVSERSGGLCERCGLRPATNVHHRKNRSQGGTWSPDNLLHLDGSGTTGCHGWIGANVKLSYDHGWLVKSFQDPASVPVWCIDDWVLLDASGGISAVELGDAA